MRTPTILPFCPRQLAPTALRRRFVGPSVVIKLAPQPEPTATETFTARRGEPSAMTHILRHWRDEDVPHCRLCPGGCRAFRARDGSGLMACLAIAPGELSGAEAGRYRATGGE